MRFCALSWCLFLLATPLLSLAQSSDAVARRQAQLEADLEATNKEIESWAKILSEKQKETVSVARDVAILNAQIAEAKATIKAKNILIEKLGKDIGEKAETIDALNKKLEDQKDALAELVRRANEIENYTLAELVLSGKNFTDFFSDLDSFSSIQKSLKELFDEIRVTREATENQKTVLSKKRDDETDARVAIEAQKRKIEKAEAEKKKLLALNQSQAKAYEGVLADKQKKAAQIRSALFSLRDTAAIPFGTAYNFALEVQKKTGVRPAFLLAILTQETNLGQNVGQCLVTDLSTGAGMGKNTGTPFKNVMKAPRDTVPFAEIAKKLGFEPSSRPVSCPQSVGYGGAMGPSQFIPSTWVLYEKRVASYGGVAIADPWLPHDAFFASGLFLMDLGAGTATYSSEFQAAARYYAGSAWKTRGQGYASSVMKHAQNIQENMIDPIQNI